MKEKKSTLFYGSWLETLRMLSDEQCGKLLMSLLDYGTTGTCADFDDFTLAVLFREYSQAIDRDNENYARRCETNRNNAMRKRSVTGACEEKRTEAMEADNDNDNDNDNDIYISIVEHLNASAGTHYKASTRKTRSLIKARLNEGFGLDDFMTVIDKKVAEWATDETMSKYLRPETLFGNKFESYLNQKTSQNAQKRVKNRFNNFEQRDNTLLIEKLEKLM